MKYVLELDIVWQTIRQLHMSCIYSKKIRYQFVTASINS